MCVFFEISTFSMLTSFEPPFWSILASFGGVLGRPGGLWGAKMDPKEAQEAPKMRYEHGRPILMKKLLFLEPQKDFEEPVLIRNGRRARVITIYEDLIEIVLSKKKINNASPFLETQCHPEHQKSFQ